MFWETYRRLEREVLELAYYIRFDDEQIDVYSEYIGELLLRCNVEIEAIAKEIYELNNGDMNLIDKKGKQRKPYYDSDCLWLINDMWKMERKEVRIIATNIHFKEQEHILLTPLKDAHIKGKESCEWKQAYQAVKHNRKKELKKANVFNLIQSMGALYLLNLYYRDEIIDLGRVYLGKREFDQSELSKLFAVAVYDARRIFITKEGVQEPGESEEYDKSVYIIKYDDASLIKLYKELLDEHGIELKEGVMMDNVRFYMSGISMVISDEKVDYKVRQMAVLNKHEKIYDKANLNSVEK